MAVQPIPATGHVLVDWRPEDESFWRSQGETIARRNLWISILALLLAFAVWMVWSAVVVNLPRVGFAYNADQLFWLAALPGLSGATLRIFYSFMVPIFGGRRWTAISTASLLIPAAGIGLAVQNPNTPYWLSCCWPCSAASAAATSPRRWPTSASFIPGHRRGARSA
jgi:MFS transporter, NNP family, nitrate/nitrite transporter